MGSEMRDEVHFGRLSLWPLIIMAVLLRHSVALRCIALHRRIFISCCCCCVHCQCCTASSHCRVAFIFNVRCRVTLSRRDVANQIVFLFFKGV